MQSKSSLLASDGWSLTACLSNLQLILRQEMCVQLASFAMQSTAGSLQSLCWASSAVGGIASAYFSGALVDAYGPRGVFGLTAVFPLMVSLSAVFISEQPVASTARHRRNSGDGQQDKAESGTVTRLAHSQSLQLNSCALSCAW